MPLRSTPEGTRIDYDEAKEFLERRGIAVPPLDKSPESSGTSVNKPPQAKKVEPQVTATAASTQSEAPVTTTKTSIVTEGQFLVWPKITTPGITVGKVVSRNTEANAVKVKCNDGTDAVFALNDLHRLIREGKVTLTGIDTLLELIEEELRYHDLNEVAALVRHARELSSQNQTELP